MTQPYGWIICPEKSAAVLEQSFDQTRHRRYKQNTKRLMNALFCVRSSIVALKALNFQTPKRLTPELPDGLLIGAITLLSRFALLLFIIVLTVIVIMIIIVVAAVHALDPDAVKQCA